VLKKELDNSTTLGLYYYIAAEAYNDYDDEIRNRYYNKAYLFFKEHNDIEGKFFSFSAINNKLLNGTTNKIAPSHKKDIESKYQEMVDFSENTNYIPVKLNLYKNYLQKERILEHPISKDIINEITNSIEENKIQYSLISRGLYTSLGISYRAKGDYKNAIIYHNKALVLANKKKQDYPSYLYNLGTTYFFNKQIDSSTYYLKNAFDIIPEKPETAYLHGLKKSTAYNLAVIYKDLGDFNSSLYFAQQAINSSEAQMQMLIDKNNAYADKKFEVQKAELKVAKKELELIEERKINTFLIVGFLASVILIFFLTYIYRKTKKLKDEANKLKDKREQLLRIVSHDLGEPLQVFSDSAIIIPKLIEQKRYDDLKQIQYAMSDTIISLQTILKNLFNWSKNSSNQNIEENTAINIIEQLNLILKSYHDVACIKRLKFNLHYREEIHFNTRASEFGNLMRNIIYNAIKHSQPDNTIHIQVEINSNQNLQFECQNTIKPHSTEDVEELVKHLNGVENEDYVYKKLGLELIDDAVRGLNARVEANLETDIFKVSISIPAKT